jgi:hypothetical protein
VIAVIFVIAGIVTLVRGGVVRGIVLIIVGLLIGPGGVSIFKGSVLHQTGEQETPQLSRRKQSFCH